MIHYEDYGIGHYEYWGMCGTDVNYVLEDDYGQTAESEEPYYITIEGIKNGKKKYWEVFVGENAYLIDDLRELVPEWFTKTFDEELGEEVELCQGYTLEEIEEDPLLVCERYSDPSPDDYYDEDDGWDD